MSLPGVKKRSSVGRVRMAFTHPQTTLVNYYVGGSGVGAVSTSNRRALRSRASWRPTQDGKGSTRCSGFCQPNRFANNVEFMRQGGRGAVNDKPEIVTRDDDVTKNVFFQSSMGESNGGHRSSYESEPTPACLTDDDVPACPYPDDCPKDTDIGEFLTNGWRSMKENEQYNYPECHNALLAIAKAGKNIKIGNGECYIECTGKCRDPSWLCIPP